MALSHQRNTGKELDDPRIVTVQVTSETLSLYYLVRLTRTERLTVTVVRLTRWTATVLRTVARTMGLHRLAIANHLLKNRS